MRRILAAILIAAVAVAAIVIVRLGSFAGPAGGWLAGRLDVAVRLGPVTIEQARSISPIARLLPEPLPPRDPLAFRGTLKGTGESLDWTAQGELAGLRFATAAKIHALTERAVEFVVTADAGEARGSIRFAEDPPKLVARLSASEGAWPGIGYRELKADIEHVQPLTTFRSSRSSPSPSSGTAARGTTASRRGASASNRR